MNTCKGHKRSRSRISSSTVQCGEQSIPIIEGISATLGPLLVQAIKAQKKVLSYVAATNQDQSTNSMKFQPNSSTASTHILDQIQQRQDHYNESSNYEFTQLSTLTEDTLNSLLQQLDRELSNRDDSIDAHSPSIACLKFLLEMIQDSSCSIILKRSAFHVTGRILWSRQKCCDWLFTYHDGSIALQRLIDSLTCEKGDTAPSNKDKYHLLHFQHEIMQLFHLLLHKYPRRYPKLLVAVRFLKEQGGFSDQDPAPTVSCENRSMTQLRYIRDVALDKGEQHITKVHRLIQIAEECFHILVPRIGLLDTSVKALEHDPIDWEDGDDYDDQFCDDEMDHLLSVDQTLNQMNARGTFSDGIMKVDLNQSEVVHQSLTKKDSVTGRAQEILHKCVVSLCTRHLPRIVSWTYALQNADSLTKRRWDKDNQEIIQSDSWLLLPEFLRKKKHSLLTRFMNLRQEIVAVIRSAGNMGITCLDNSVSNFIASPGSPPVILGADPLQVGVQHAKPSNVHLLFMDEPEVCMSSGVNIRVHEKIRKRKNTERIHIKLL